MGCKVASCVIRPIHGQRAVRKSCLFMPFHHTLRMLDMVGQPCFVTHAPASSPSHCSVCALGNRSHSWTIHGIRACGTTPFGHSHGMHGARQTLHHLERLACKQHFASCRNCTRVGLKPYLSKTWRQMLTPNVDSTELMIALWPQAQDCIAKFGLAKMMSHASKRPS